MTTSSRLSRLLLPVPVAAAVALAASSASAQQQSNCPPGSWFCADAPEKPAAPAGQPVAPSTPPPKDSKGLEPLPPPASEQPATPPQAAPAQPPPAVVYQPAPPVVVYQPPPPVVVREAPPPYYYHPRKNDGLARRREWGLNLRLEGAILGHGASHDSGMGGAGFGVRYKPVPAFGIEADLDFFGGRDYYDNKRAETAFALNALVFVNPRSKAQVYFLAGFGWSGAHVEDDRSMAYSTTDYHYFGGQIGAGMEFRLAKHFALNLDVRGFIRGRTDDNAQAQPEFVDANGRTTNTSGGGLVTGGMTFYF